MFLNIIRIVLLIYLEFTWAQPIEHAARDHYKFRCTRRFTPGVCSSGVVSVWTFEFQIMNCSERLGCAQAERTNRFETYRACIIRCQPLIDLYLQILSSGDDNDTKYLRHGAGLIPSRREDVRAWFAKPPDSGGAEAEGAAAADEAVMSRALYGDGPMHREDDIDYERQTRHLDDYSVFN